MAVATAQEQLMLELINRARLNPVAEAQRFGIAISAAQQVPKSVLAMNDALRIAADNHSNWMLVNDQFDHVESPAFPSGRTGLNPDDRMTAAGYVFSGPAIAAGENISWTGSTGAVNLTTAIIAQHKSLFLSSGHRANILSDDFREAGIGQLAGLFFSNGTNFNASMVTQVFGLSGTKIFVTGVIYNDTVTNDNFFTVGEQTAGRAVTGPGASDTTGAGGGYELGFTTTGSKTLTFDLVSGDVQVAVTVGTKNIKVDVVNGSEVWTDSNLTVLSANVTQIRTLGLGATQLTGGGGNENIYGNKANNVLRGGLGNDLLEGSVGSDTMFGQGGSDTYFVNSSGDICNETGGTGTDQVQSGISFSLANVAKVIGDVERLSLVGITAVLATGNGLSNLLTGNTINNVMSGAAGLDVLRGMLGNDTMTGGADADIFVFNTALNATTNRDTIQDFTPVDDTIQLDNAIFTKLVATGGLNAGLFRVGAPLDSNDHIIYNTTNGALFYDSNGNVAGGATQFATLTGVPAITAADFVVI